MRRSGSLTSTLLFTVILASACSSNPEPEPIDTTPTETPPPEIDEAAAEAARREAEADRLCDRAMSSLEAGNYNAARDLFRQVQADYPDTECGRNASDELVRADAMDAIQARVHFVFDRSSITDESAAVLQRKAEALRAFPDVRLTIEGHCDERGSLEYNRALGLRRAEAAKAYLVTLGIDAARFRTVTFGEERPLDGGSNESAWAQNRRDEFVIEGGGM